MFEQSGKTILKATLLVIIILGIAGYALYQAKNLILGPQLIVESPLDGSTVGQAAVVIKGIAKNIAYISLNDRQIYVDKDGVFNEELLLAPGYNIWKVEAKDKFGRIVSKKIELIFNKSS
jgi:hypothetical protein